MAYLLSCCSFWWPVTLWPLCITSLYARTVCSHACGLVRAVRSADNQKSLAESSFNPYHIHFWIHAIELFSPTMDWPQLAQFQPLFGLHVGDARPAIRGGIDKDSLPLLIVAG